MFKGWAELLGGVVPLILTGSEYGLGTSRLCVGEVLGDVGGDLLVLIGCE